jgi:hypothetical protein
MRGSTPHRSPTGSLSSPGSPDGALPGVLAHADGTRALRPMGRLRRRKPGIAVRIREGPLPKRRGTSSREKVLRKQHRGPGRAERRTSMRGLKNHPDEVAGVRGRKYPLWKPQSRSFATWCMERARPQHRMLLAAGGAGSSPAQGTSGPVAQQGERWVCNPEVARSIRVGSTIRELLRVGFAAHPRSCP